eukprot:1446818-Pyramimonas_sp.AAC.1
MSLCSPVRALLLPPVLSFVPRFRRTSSVAPALATVPSPLLPPSGGPAPSLSARINSLNLCRTL